MMASATPPTIQRCLTTKRPQGTQPWPELEVRRRKPIRSSRGAMVARITGRRVIATSTEMSGMRRPPYPMLRRKGTGSTTRARRPMATAMPLKITAAPACCMVWSTASSGSRPAARSSRQRITISSE